MSGVWKGPEWILNAFMRFEGLDNFWTVFGSFRPPFDPFIAILTIFGCFGVYLGLKPTGKIDFFGQKSKKSKIFKKNRKFSEKSKKIDLTEKNRKKID